MIKVIGVGGAGGNAVDHMIREGVNGVDFVAANTDAQASSAAAHPDQAAARQERSVPARKPEAGRNAAVERERIAESLKGAHYGFHHRRHGGGTGTGAAPIVAEVARASWHPDRRRRHQALRLRRQAHEGGRRPASPNCRSTSTR